MSPGAFRKEGTAHDFVVTIANGERLLFGGRRQEHLYWCDKGHSKKEKSLCRNLQT